MFTLWLCAPHVAPFYYKPLALLLEHAMCPPVFYFISTVILSTEQQMLSPAIHHRDQTMSLIEIFYLIVRVHFMYRTKLSSLAIFVAS